MGYNEEKLCKVFLLKFIDVCSDNICSIWKIYNDKYMCDVR